MQHTNLLVVDIETVPDSDHHEGDAFAIPPFHKIVAIAFLEAGIRRVEAGEEFDLKQLRSGGELHFDEKRLLQGFFQYFDQLQPRLVTYNGRGFDVPVLKYRAMLHGVTAYWLHHGGSRYENYSYRYSTDWHCDLLEALSDFKVSKAPKLNEVSKLFGFPGKFGLDGSQIKEVYEAGGLREIRDYCETDVLNTYLVYLRYMLHRGDVHKDAYNKAVSDVVSLIETERTVRPHLGEFLEAWRGSGGGQFQLP